MSEFEQSGRLADTSHRSGTEYCTTGFGQNTTFPLFSGRSQMPQFRSFLSRCRYFQERPIADYAAKTGEQEYGRLISTSSEAMIFGSAGQPNYAAAKAGITAMTMGAEQLMIMYSITCNVIMPRARTAMIDQGPTAAMFAAPEEGFDYFESDNVAPFVGYLASPEAGHIAGEDFVVWGARFNIVQRPSLDVFYDNPKGDKWEIDDLHNRLSEYFSADHTPVLDGFSVPPQ